MQSFSGIVDRVAMVIDGVGIAVILLSMVVATVRRVTDRNHDADPFRSFRQDIGRGILLGLEFLVAADIIRTVAVTPTVQGVLLLGLIVLIRTFLSMALQVELEGRWPWRNADQAAAPTTDKPR